ncbi:MAG: phosphatase PAP2 family protein [Nitratireductor sp.]|nr:phosphatase PAP2 family protein [Nitratireductor sp.]
MNARALHWSSGFSPAELAAERRLALRVLLVTAVAGLLGALAFTVWPQLDIALARQLFADGDFALRGSDVWSALRRFNMIAYGAFYALVVLGLVGAVRHRGRFWRLAPVQWLYLLATSLTGPLLVTNVILKDNVGRPRPRAVSEFGGEFDFKRLFESGGQCVDNCSFVSGEVSSMVMIAISLFFVLPKWRRPLAFLLFPAWFYAAYMRVGQGGHFPSDTFFAGIFMVAIAAIFYRYVVLGGEGRQNRNA